MHNLIGTNFFIKKSQENLQGTRDRKVCYLMREEAWVNIGGWRPKEYRIEYWSLECVSGYNEQGV